MKAIFKLIAAIAITMAISTTLTMKTIHYDNADGEAMQAEHEQKHEMTIMPSRRASRFLAEEKNPRAADHCHKDNEICNVLGGDNNKNSTCCSNKCVDLAYDKQNCGACKQKCKFMHTCCRGECVNISFDKRHCGQCNNSCMPGGYCIYGMCDYA